MSAAPAVPRVTDSLARSARERFQPRYREPLTDASGQDIATNLLGMLGMYQEWHAKRIAEGGKAPSRPPSARFNKPKRRVSTTQE